MSELTYEAIIDAVKKSLDYKPTDNPYIYSHADMHVAIVAGREAERERIIRILKIELDEDKLEEITWLINDINIL